MPSKKKSHRETREEENALLTSADGATDEGSEDDTRQRVRLRSGSATLLRKRYHMQRGVRRMGRVLIYVVLASMLLLMLLYLPIYTDVQSRHTSIAGWPFNTSRDIKNYVWPLRDSALLAPRDFCRQKAFVIISIGSALNNFVQRQTIRETWGNTTEFNYATFAKLHAHLKGRYLEPTSERLRYYASYLSGEGATLAAKVRIVFIVGRSKYESLLGNETRLRLHNEAEQYNDIIQEDFIDSYNNLTLKSVLAMKYISRHCSNTSAFFLKCDDDTFVNVPNLLHFLLGGTVPLYNDTLEYYDLVSFRVMSAENRLNATKEIMRGHQFCGSKPISDVTSKWYMPYYMYPLEVYPKYLSGAGYLMSMDVVGRLYETSLNTSIIYLEDVYITALCAERAKIKRHHHPLFSYTHSKHSCAFKGSITQHEVKDDSMMEAWQFVSNFSIKCPPPGRYFKQTRLRKRMNC